MAEADKIPQTYPAEVELLIERIKQSNLEPMTVDKVERLLRLALKTRRTITLQKCLAQVTQHSHG
jgi:hypothetical protein